MSVLQLLFAGLLVLANGFFVGAEFALVSVRRSQIEPLGTARSRQVLYGLERLPQMMAAAQFGITMCSLTLGAVAEPTVAHLLEPVFEAVRLPDGVIHPLGYVIALALVVFFHLVIGEMVPKNLAMAAPEKTALWLSPGLVAFARLCRPVTVGLGACARLILKLFRVEPRDEVEAVFTSEQLNRLVEDSDRRPPRPRGAGAPRGRPGARLPSGHRRPARRRLAGHRGLLGHPGPGRRAHRAYRVLPFPGRRRERRLHGLLSACEGRPRPGGVRPCGPAADVAPHDHPAVRTPLDDALTVMRRAATHLAQVADASGKVLGLVALEDVLELLVGEVRDPAHRVVAPVRVAEPRPSPAPEEALAS